MHDTPPGASVWCGLRRLYRLLKPRLTSPDDAITTTDNLSGTQEIR